jgi:hypothetical protein
VQSAYIVSFHSFPDYGSLPLCGKVFIKCSSSKEPSINSSNPDHLRNECLSYSLFRRRAEIIVAGNIVAPPLRERLRCSSCAEDSERHDEQRAQRGAIERAHDHVSVLPEEARLVVTQVELREETGNDPAQKDACLRLVVRDVASVLDELGEVHGRNGDAGNAWLEL